MWREKINVLAVEEDLHVRESIEDALARPRVGLESPRFKLEAVATLQAAVNRLQKPGIDAMLVGIHRRDSAGFQWIARLSAHSPQIPIVALLDASDERLAIAASSVGAAESLCGEQILLLPHALRYLIGLHRAELAVAQSEENFQVLIEHASDITTLVNAQLMIRYISPAVQPALGYAPADLRGHELSAWLHPDDASAARMALRSTLQNPGQPITIEVRFRHCEGRWVDLEIVGRNVPGRDGQPRLVLNARDITERRKLEAQLRRIQKLELPVRPRKIRGMRGAKTFNLSPASESAKMLLKGSTHNAKDFKAGSKTGRANRPNGFT